MRILRRDRIRFPGGAVLLALLPPPPSSTAAPAVGGPGTPAAVDLAPRRPCGLSTRRPSSRATRSMRPVLWASPCGPRGRTTALRRGPFLLRPPHQRAPPHRQMLGRRRLRRMLGGRGGGVLNGGAWLTVEGRRVVVH
ncbi:hypothetical protein [Streptomyces europaeiscabiei]|uniref:hypothetical protein n=1 Tax=Streptomyces europaeiscabiei TaxID=146819 RepID=UPI0029B36BBD|nr:hypothetical protein [Streptomyces europaeiscabiei]MDX2529845.1 hypothetical protein [Streptomyces europaeiscabiei]